MRAWAGPWAWKQGVHLGTGLSVCGGQRHPFMRSICHHVLKPEPSPLTKGPCHGHLWGQASSHLEGSRIPPQSPGAQHLLLPLWGHLPSGRGHVTSSAAIKTLRTLQTASGSVRPPRVSLHHDSLAVLPTETLTWKLLKGARLWISGSIQRPWLFLLMRKRLHDTKLALLKMQGAF